MRWTESLLRSKNRRLELSTGGGWYLVFTLLLGIFAIQSNNNVLYLLESLLLSSLLVSGVLSEWTVSRIQVARLLTQASAGSESADRLLVQNRGWLPLYCVEIGEWDGKNFDSLVFLLLVPGRARLRVRSRQRLQARGKHSFQGLAVATSFPFGLARKLRILEEPGSRIVWPAAIEEKLGARPQLPAEEWDHLLGELEEVPAGSDLQRVHWPSSARTLALYARPLCRLASEEEVRLDWDRPGPELERRICLAAGKLQSHSALVLSHQGEHSRILGKVRALDALALLPKEER